MFGRKEETAICCISLINSFRGIMPYIQLSELLIHDFAPPQRVKQEQYNITELNFPKTLAIL